MTGDGSVLRRRCMAQRGLIERFRCGRSVAPDARIGLVRKMLAMPCHELPRESLNENHR